MLGVSTSVLELAQAATWAECMQSVEVCVEGFSFVDTCKNNYLIKQLLFTFALDAYACRQLPLGFKYDMIW
jgi:hypothetical protein